MEKRPKKSCDTATLSSYVLMIIISTSTMLYRLIMNTCTMIYSYWCLRIPVRCNTNNYEYHYLAILMIISTSTMLQYNNVYEYQYHAILIFMNTIALQYWWLSVPVPCYNDVHEYQYLTMIIMNTCTKLKWFLKLPVPCNTVFEF